MARGPEAGLQLLAEPWLEAALAGYHLFHAAVADLQRRAGRLQAAEAAYRQALELTANEAERTFLRRRLGEVVGAEPL